MSHAAQAFVLIALLVAGIIGGPFAIIWAVNTLFHTGIAYTFWTWLAAFVVSGPFLYNGAKR